MELFVNRAGEDALVTTIANLGAIAGKCDPNKVRVEYTIESHGGPACMLGHSPAVTGTSRIEVDAGGVLVRVNCDRAVPHQTMFRCAIRALCRVIAKRTPKAAEVSIECGKRKAIRARYYTFKM